MSRTVISAEGLGKQYAIGGRDRNTETFREMLMSSLAAPFRRLRKLRGDVALEERIWALKDVGFEVKEGEVVGIIGRNGAGKSTLLKILSRITEPTEGRLAIHGRVASLLEVGTGFHPELTGRENIYLNGAILGMSRAEIRERFDEIVDFSGVGRFLDTPVKRYSSGMYVRLAFSVAAHLEPDILVIDEVLSVGDGEFQKKCLGKMHSAAQGGRTVLVVSHNMPMIRNLCERGLVFSAGSIIYDGQVEDSIERYLDLTRQLPETCPLRDRVDRIGDGRLRFLDARIVGRHGANNIARMGDETEIRLWFSAPGVIIKKCDVSIVIKDSSEQIVLRLATRESAKPFADLTGEGIIACKLPSMRLLPGEYQISLAASVPPAFEYLDNVRNAATFEVVENDVFGTGRIPEVGTFFSECEWNSSVVPLAANFLCDHEARTDECLD